MKRIGKLFLCAMFVMCAALLVAQETVSADDGFVFIEGGSFSMGSAFGRRDENPVHKVFLSSFYMSDHEVTQAEYKKVMGTNPSYYSGDNRPVENVRWYDAIEYCNKLSEMKGLTPCYSKNGNSYTCDFTANGYRLPTEAEWEYAAGGGNKSNGYIFSGSNGYTTDSEKVYDIGSVAWYDVEMGWGSTHDIKTKQPNELGLYDMSGNVWEWCWDLYGSYSSSAQANPTGLSSGHSRVYRGGSWNCYWFECRVAERNHSGPDYYFSDLGFRVVRTDVESLKQVEPLKQPEQSQSSEAIPESTVSELENDYINDNISVLVEGGSFNMRKSGDDWTVQSVSVSSFYMSDHEVTQAEYEEVMGWNPSSYSGDNLPVNKVSWYDAVRYCNSLSEKEGLKPCYSKNGNSYTCDFSANGYRLPTEAEWEYAARGGNKSKGYAYSGSNDIGSVAWCSYNSSRQTHDVKTNLPNELGLYDMSGNIWEWCWDRYGDYDRVLRGGDWSDDAYRCGVTSRLNDKPDFVCGSFGFRVVRTAK